MTLLEKILFVADYIEPNRSSKWIPDLNEVRKLSFQNINNAIYQILKNTLHYLNIKNQELDSITVDAYNYYKI